MIANNHTEYFYRIFTRNTCIYKCYMKFHFIMHLTFCIFLAGTYFKTSFVLSIFESYLLQGVVNWFVIIACVQILCTVLIMNKTEERFIKVVDISFDKSKEAISLRKNVIFCHLLLINISSKSLFTQFVQFI